MEGAKKIVRDLYGHFVAEPDELPDTVAAGCGGGGAGAVVGPISSPE